MRYVRFGPRLPSSPALWIPPLKSSTPKNPPTWQLFFLSSKGIGTSSEVETTLTIVETEIGSRVRWAADVKRLGGLLKAVPSGLISGAAQKTIEDVWAGIGKRLDSAV